MASAEFCPNSFNITYIKFHLDQTIIRYRPAPALQLAQGTRLRVSVACHSKLRTCLLQIELLFLPFAVILYGTNCYFSWSTVFRSDRNVLVVLSNFDSSDGDKLRLLRVCYSPTLKTIAFGNYEMFCITNRHMTLFDPLEECDAPYSVENYKTL